MHLVRVIDSRLVRDQKGRKGQNHGVLPTSNIQYHMLTTELELRMEIGWGMGMGVGNSQTNRIGDATLN